MSRPAPSCSATPLPVSTRPTMWKGTPATCSAADRVRRQGEGQHVVVAAAQRQRPAPALAGRRAQRGAQRQARRLDHQAHARGRGDVPAVGEQAVGDVQRRAGQPAQRLAEGQLRLRRPVARQQLRVARAHRRARAEHQRQRGGRLAGRPADAQQVARPGARAQQRLPGRQGAEYSDVDVQRAAGGVAADQRQPAGARHHVEAAGEGLQPGRLGGRQGQRQGEAQRRGAHGSEVAGRGGQAALGEQEGVAGSWGNAPRRPGYRWTPPGARRAAGCSSAQSSPMPSATPGPAWRRRAAAK